ncbi:hypothetical protein LOD99_5152 [Oopsacas minuta]|uniref:ER membrane protein complex subunit 3 n=1 Tax=Oopsacas minuta TaxID=111878 RepID=A0AAV7JSP0_9METZ|nr:hypothetical protein LOD99_5152 [Oopsacas minuta]
MLITMSETELTLDPATRLWVLLPIFLITFLFNICVHYITTIFSSPHDKNVTPQEIKDSQALVRAKQLIRNGGLIPKEAFLSRKSYFNDPEDGYFKQTRPTLNMLQDPSAMLNMQMGKMAHIIPMMLIGGWMSYVFSGFLLTKVPFPLTARFKPMLQTGVDIENLDASWVSSMSLYILCAFGLRSIYPIILGETSAALDQTKLFADQAETMAAGLKQQDMNKIFKAEWEGLEVACYEDGLEKVLDQFLKQECLNETVEEYPRPETKGKHKAKLA